MTDSSNTESKIVGESGVPTRNLKQTLLKCAVVVAILGVLVCMLLPSVRIAGPTARKVQCLSNLRNVGLAVQNYMSTNGSFPPAYTVDADGKPLHSWRTLILPYLDQKDLYDQIDLTKPWNDPVNATAHATRVSDFTCPDARCPPNHTVYLAVVAPSGCFRPGTPRPLSDITDDHGLTLMLLEVDSADAVHWMSPLDADEQVVMGVGKRTKGQHKGGFNAICVDGSGKFLSNQLAPEVRRAMVSIAGNDDNVAAGGK